MRDELEFIILEGAMIVIAVTVLTVFHPGYCFPALASGNKAKSVRGKSVSEDEDVEMMAARPQSS